MSETVLAVDLGGTNLRTAGVGADGTISVRVQERTPESKSSADVVAVVSRSIGECLLEMPVKPEAVALAVPGTIGANSGIVNRAPNIPGLDGFDLEHAVSEACGLPVIIENDANAAAVGESWLGSSKGAATSIMVTLGTGVGGGIIIDGKLVRGLDGTAGEIGHVCVEPNGPVCGCGSHGCVEQYSSASAVVRMARDAIEKNPSLERSGLEAEGSKWVFDAAVAGEPWAKRIFEVQGYYLGIVLAGLVNTLNPEVVVIGGGAAAAWDEFYPVLEDQVLKRTYAEASARARIVPAALGDNAGILGAAHLGFKRVRSKTDVAV
ncbi:MAG: ROK family protein [Pyrinomonadaceae bacterium]|nr:ROK family protein [Pyrinomonadaceae bacterium]